MEKALIIDRINRIRLWTVTANVQSTNVKRMKYDSIMKELVIEFWGGGYYTYFGVDETLYDNVRYGNAATKTAGDWGPEGTSPSVGAAVHRYLIEQNIRYQEGGTI
jgi:hypothetical protein